MESRRAGLSGCLVLAAIGCSARRVVEQASTGDAAVSSALVPPAPTRPARTGDARSWAVIDGTSPLLRKGIDEVRRDPPDSAGAHTASYTQFYRGVRVYNAGFAIDTDAASGEQYVSGEFRAGIDIAAEPILSAPRASALAREYFSKRGRPVPETADVELLVYPARMPASRWHLCFRVHFGRSTVAIVDARDGTLLYDDDGIRY